MAKIKSFFNDKRTIFIVALLSGIAAAVYYAFRTTYVFTDSAVFNGFSLLLLIISVINTLLLIALYMFKSKEKAFDFIYLVCLGLTVGFTIFNIINFINCGPETAPVIMRMIKAELPYLLSVFTIIFLVTAFPKMKKGVFKNIIAAVIVIAVLVSGILKLFPCYNYKITSDPMVIDSGENYSVVFPTNDNGTGYITYQYNGEDYKIYDEDGGRIHGDSKIHTLTVPKEHLNGNTYKVGSVRVIDELSYGGHSGQEVVSNEYHFNAPSAEKQSYLTVSDWHAKLKNVYKAIENIGEYDGVIMLGDAVPGVMFEDEIAKYIIEFGGNISKGVKPIIYVRGNHETRGPEAAKLNDYLGLESFYYTTQYGDYEFIALDSGEDKEDSHPEYGGMVCYGDYRKDMINWLDSITVGDKTLALSHSSDICFEEDLHDRAYTQLKKLGVNQIISGHTHYMEYFEEDGLQIYRDGGYNDNKYIASKLTLENDGYTIEACDNDGEKVFEKN